VCAGRQVGVGVRERKQARERGRAGDGAEGQERECSGHGRQAGSGRGSGCRLHAHTHTYLCTRISRACAAGRNPCRPIDVPSGASATACVGEGRAFARSRPTRLSTAVQIRHNNQASCISPDISGVFASASAGDKAATTRGQGRTFLPGSKPTRLHMEAVTPEPEWLAFSHEAIMRRSDALPEPRRKLDKHM
jgi:hypothetical protein